MAVAAACILFLIVAGLAEGQSNSSKVWILIEDASVYECRGISNKFHIAEKDVSVTNSKGQKLYYIEAPGEYVIAFRNIKVDEDLPNLMGQTSAVLQVPIVSVGKSLSWDYPYKLIPEQSMFGGYRCDNASGVVQENGKPYCRYCDLCATTKQVDQLLNKGSHKYVPKLGQSEEPFDKTCVQIGPRSYVMTRTVSLPSKQELERQVNSQGKGVEEQLKKKLNKGKGKLQMELQVKSCDQPPVDRQSVYSSSSNCRCCLGVSDLSCKVGSFLGGGCNKDKCSAEYAQKCVQGQCQTVGCYTVQFRYTVTDKYDDVKTFCQSQPHKCQQDKKDGQSDNANAESKSKTKTSNAGGSTTKTASGVKQSKEQCLAKLEPRMREVCEYHWQDRPCCTLCNGC